MEWNQRIYCCSSENPCWNHLSAIALNSMLEDEGIEWTSLFVRQVKSSKTGSPRLLLHLDWINHSKRKREIDEMLGRVKRTCFYKKPDDGRVSKLILDLRSIEDNPVNKQIFDHLEKITEIIITIKGLSKLHSTIHPRVYPNLNKITLKKGGSKGLFSLSNTKKILNMAPNLQTLVIAKDIFLSNKSKKKLSKVSKHWTVITDLRS